MKKIFYLAIVPFLLLITRANAQDAVHIAIIPFTASATTATANAVTSLVEEQVASCFVNKGRFYLLDRGVTEKLKKELDAAKDNSSLYAKVVAQQGHLAGAQYIITGKVNDWAVVPNKTTNMYNKVVTTYHGNLKASIQINSVESGQVVFSEPFSIVSNEFDNATATDIFDDAACKFKAAVRAKVRNLFSSTITIIHVEKEKNGVPQQVLINAGKDIFEDGKNSGCAVVTSSSLAAIGNLFTKKIRLEVISTEEVTYGGSTSKREKKIGELKISSVEGEVAVCDVTDGAKDIKTYLDAKKPLTVKIQDQ
jgi:hypothetical protein